MTSRKEGEGAQWGRFRKIVKQNFETKNNCSNNTLIYHKGDETLVFDHLSD